MRCVNETSGAGGTATDGGSSTDGGTHAVTVVATPTPDKLTETVSLVQYGSAGTNIAGARCAQTTGTAVPVGRRRRASMQDALDHTKINTSLYDPTLVYDDLDHICLCDSVQ